MANKGNNRHLKRLAASKYMRISKKGNAYIAKPLPGPHALHSSITIASLLRDKLHIAGSYSDAKSITGSEGIEINGKIIRNEKHPVGFPDIIHIIPAHEYYKIKIGKNANFGIEKCADTEVRTLKIINKYTLRGGKPMVRLMDGSVIPAAEGMKVNDSVVLSKEGTKTITMEKGAKCLVISGTHASESGVIAELIKGSATRPAIAKVSGAAEFETPLRNIMAIE